MIRHHSQTAPIRVLCVDGDSYLTDLLRYALGRDGFTVTVAGTGAEGRCAVRRPIRPTSCCSTWACPTSTASPCATASAGSCGSR